MFCIEGLENSYCFIYFKCLVVFAILTTSSTPNVLSMTTRMKLDGKLSKVEEDFSYEYDIYEIGLCFGDRSNKETD